MRNTFLKRRRYSSAMGGVDAVTGEVWPVDDTANFRDDVTGVRVPMRNVCIQDGLVKDNRPSKGSFDIFPVVGAYGWFIGYDPSLGEPTIPCEWDEDM